MQTEVAWTCEKKGDTDCVTALARLVVEGMALVSRPRKTWQKFTLGTSTTEYNVLRRMCRVTRKDIMKNEYRLRAVGLVNV